MVISSISTELFFAFVFIIFGGICLLCERIFFGWNVKQEIPKIYTSTESEKNISTEISNRYRKGKYICLSLGVFLVVISVGLLTLGLVNINSKGFPVYIVCPDSPGRSLAELNEDLSQEKLKYAQFIETVGDSDDKDNRGRIKYLSDEVKRIETHVDEIRALIDSSAKITEDSPVVVTYVTEPTDARIIKKKIRGELLDELYGQFGIYVYKNPNYQSVVINQAELVVLDYEDIQKTVPGVPEATMESVVLHYEISPQNKPLPWSFTPLYKSVYDMESVIHSHLETNPVIIPDHWPVHIRFNIRATVAGFYQVQPRLHFTTSSGNISKDIGNPTWFLFLEVVPEPNDEINRVQSHSVAPYNNVDL